MSEASGISKYVEESMVENTHLITPAHINGDGRLFGGILMEWIDETAGIVARRHAGGIVTTACVDNLNFLEGAYNGDAIVLRGRITYVGTTSMEVRVHTYVESLSGERKLINEAFLVMVAVDKEGKTLEVPGLRIASEDQLRDWNEGRKRYEMRRERRKSQSR